VQTLKSLFSLPGQAAHKAGEVLGRLFYLIGVYMPFTTIDHDLRKKFNLTLNEYAICDSVYFLCRRYPCNASKEYLGEFIGISRQSAQSIINKMITKKLIKKVSFGCIETTDLWNKEIEDGKRSVKKVDTECKESLQLSVKKVDTKCKESLHNKDIISTTNNNNIKNNELFHFVDDLFKTYNPNYYPDGKENTNVKKLITRFKTKEKINEIFVSYIKQTDPNTKDKFWMSQPLTPSSLLSNVDRLLKIKDSEKKSGMPLL
jgi:hypothetical protein